MSRGRTKSAGPIDWAAVRRRLARVEEGVTDGEMPPARARAIMDDRAQRLARTQAPAQRAGDAIEALTFALGPERYAVETRYAREVVRLAHISPVPGVLPFVMGVTNYRGQILCVFDLRLLLGAPAAGMTDPSRLIVLGDRGVEFGVLADRADEIRSLHAEEILAPPDAVTGTGREYVRGVTRDALTLLDAAWLLRDPRLMPGSAPPAQQRP
jgi:purine-binding chemotaxis protein CheW